MKISSFLTMAVFVAGMATTCFTMTSCTVEDNAVGDADEVKEEIEFEIPATATAAMPGSFIVEAKVLGCERAGSMENLFKKYSKDGWEVIKTNLNQGAGGRYVYLAVRRSSLLSKDQFGYITDFYLSNKEYKRQPSLKFGDSTYFPVGIDGDQNFDGNLNSNTSRKGDQIYLYYTKDLNDVPMAVTNVTFDEQKKGNGVVGKEGKTTGPKDNVAFYGYDLNAGTRCGFEIYMHLKTEYKPCWKIDAFSTDGTACTLYGFKGSTEGTTAVAIPTSFNGMKVTACGNINSLKDLVVLNYYDLTNLKYFPLLSGCTKLKAFYQVDGGGNVITENTVPNYITTIGDYTFKNTAIDSINLPGVKVVGEDAFLGCNSLKQVELGDSALVGSGAFSFIKSEKCVVTYPGTVKFWDQRSLLCSPNVTVVGITDQETKKAAYWGWCGGDSEYAENGMSWHLGVTGEETVEGKTKYIADLNIACAVNDYLSNSPDNQRITNHNWEAYIKDMKLENLYLKDVVSVGEKEFENTPVSHVHLYPGLKKIGNKAFDNRNVKSITYHGTEEQWEAVNKDYFWRFGGDSIIANVIIKP